MSNDNIYSNAFNFSSYISTGVDSRTGQYSATINLVTLRPHNISGFEQALSLSFSPLSFSSKGFGLGWRLALSTLDTVGLTLTKADGKSYKSKTLPPSGNDLYFKDQKLQDFRVHKVDDKNFTVINKNGTIEHLFRPSSSNVAKIIALEFPNGEAFEFSYGKLIDGEQYLTEVTHRQTGTTHLTLNYNGSQCTSFEYPEDNSITAKIAMRYSNDYLIAVTVPYDNTKEPSTPDEYAKFAIDYDLLQDAFPVITTFRTPAASVETVSYVSEGHHATDDFLIPYAAVHKTFPGNGQPAITKKYEFSTVNNFLGYSSGKVDFATDEDNLYLVLGEYTYSSIEKLLDEDGSTVSLTERFFNKFHLMTKERKTQLNSQVITEIEYNEDPSKQFVDQPANLQQPRLVTTTYKDLLTEKTRTETVETISDDWGNTTQTTEASGIKKDYVYYSGTEASEGCPVDPLGFTRFLKSLTQTPVSIEGAETEPKVTTYTYSELGTFEQAHISAYIVKATEEINDKVSKSFVYVDDTTSNTHGLLSTITSVMDGQTSNIQMSHLYEAGTITTDAVITGYDNSTMQSQSVVSVFTQRQLQNTDVNQIVTVQEYDLLGRITKQASAPDTPEEICRTYEYIYPRGDDNNVWPVMAETDAIGVGRKTFYDGLGRVVSLQEQDDDGTSSKSATYSGTYREVLAKTYDVFGNVVEEKSSDWLWDLSSSSPARMATPQTSTKSYEFDAWGNKYRTTHSDGRIELEIHDPIENTVTQGIEGQGMFKATINAFEQPATVTQINIDETNYCELSYGYDGFGRLISESDAAGNLTLSTYDVFDRIVSKTLPDLTVLNTTYADFSNESLPVSVKVNDTALGEMTYDGLGRAMSDTVGGRTSTYVYEKGGDKPSKVTTPENTQQDLTYLMQLGGVLSQFKSSSNQQNFTYQPQSGVLLSATEGNVKSEFDYFPSGVLQQESMTEQGKTVSSGSYLYTMSGLIQRHTDSFGQHHDYIYDDNGKLIESIQGDQRAGYKYNALGQLITTVTYDESAGLQLETQLTYDDFGREISRVVTSENSVHKTELTYTTDNQIKLRVTTIDDVVVLHESYAYDKTKRLSQYQCEGDQSPITESGRMLCQQTYQYDQWGNIVQLDNEYIDGAETFTYQFSDLDPTQLVTISQGGNSVELEYDANGNLTKDEKGQQLIYDDAGRISHVNNANGELVCTYQYDAMNKLISQTFSDGTQNTQFYASGKVINAQFNDEKVTYLCNDEHRLGHQSQAGDNTEFCQYVGDHHNTVVATQRNGEIETFTYTPYGFRSLMSNLPGFNGAQIDPVTGWYFLGNGYRVFNPVLMRFHSPDNWSPFGKGGINPYVYCQNDPINRLDPNGHLSSQGIAGIVLGSIGILIGIVTLGAGAAVSAGLVAGGGAVGAIATTSTIGVTATVVGIAADATGIASAALEEKDPQASQALNWASKGLGILSAVGGIAELASTAVRSASTAGKAASTAAESATDVGKASSRSATSTSWGLGDTLTAVSEGSNLVSNTTGMAAAGLADENANAANVLGWVSIGFGAVGAASGIANMASSSYSAKYSQSWDVDSGSSGKGGDSESPVTLRRVKKLEDNAIAANPPHRAVEVNSSLRNSQGNQFTDSTVTARKLMRRRLTV